MTFVHVAQIVLWAAGLVIIWRGIRQMFFVQGGLDGRYADAVIASLDADERGRAEALGAAAGWLPQIVRTAFKASADGVDLGIALDEARREIGFEVQQGTRALRVLASLASASGLLGACWEFFWLTGGDHGLAGLMAGLPLQIAMRRALLAVGLGFGAMTLVLAARTQLTREARIQLARARKLAEALESRLGPAPE